MISRIGQSIIHWVVQAVLWVLPRFATFFLLGTAIVLIALSAFFIIEKMHRTNESTDDRAYRSTPIFIVLVAMVVGVVSLFIPLW